MDTDFVIDDALTNDSKKSKMYQIMKHREHIVARPDTYVGKTTLDNVEMYVHQDNKMVFRSVQIVPAITKLFDEGMVNMRDHVERMKDKKRKLEQLKNGESIDDPTIDVNDVYKEVKNIRVDIDVETNTITLENDGNGIDIIMHDVEKIYVPQLIFFELLSGTNFNDKEERTWGGRNGYGSKLISIFSTECTIETVDIIRKLKYKQRCLKNMSIIEKPEITKYRGAPFTRLVFKLDLNIFGLNSLSEYDHLLAIEKRVIDIAACTDRDVNVYYNSTKIDIKDFEKYIDLFIGSKKESKRIKINPNPRWEVYVSLTANEKFEQVSFVNGISTTRGGKHVDHVSTIISNQVAEYIKDNKKSLKDIKPAMVKNCLWLFIKSTIINPDFDNQMKDYLTTPSKSFGSKFELSKDDLAKLSKLGVIDSCIQMLTEKNQKNFKKMDGEKTVKVKDEKSVDAKYAGTELSSECILVLTEGDSAKTLAISGLGALSQEERYRIGVMPLGGKLINVKKVTLDRVNNNKEFNRIKKMMGLKHGSSDPKKLRYGHIAIMTDADHDGSHIKALLFNMFHRFWPDLLKTPRFFLSIRTPIIKAQHKKRKSDVKFFYNYISFNEWQNDSNNNATSYDFQYYKGLGTHTAEEARDIFTNIKYVDYKWDNSLEYNWINIDLMTQGKVIGNQVVDDQVVDDQKGGNNQQISSNKHQYYNENSLQLSPKYKKIEKIFGGLKDYCDVSFNLAFDDKLSDYRKDWLYKYLVMKANGKINYQFHKQNSLSYFNFLNSELIEYSIEDCNRSIPNVMDGLKPSTRKIISCCLKRNLTQKIKVEQLGGHISEKSNYHHGAQSLLDAIILLAQDYVGSNNINLLMPIGQFGTRVQNGDDHASPRYIFTHLNPIINVLFDKNDNQLLEYVKDEGKIWEPVFYVPIIPLVLVNGARGIGTGWSTDIPMYNTLDIKNNTIKYLNGEQMIDMIPYYRGFKGTITQVEPNRYIVKGVYKRFDNYVEISEIPVGCKESMSFETYKNFAENLNEKYPDVIKHSETYYTDTTIDCKIIFKNGKLSDIDNDELEKMLKLSHTISLKNMNLYDPNNVLKHYNSANEILTDFIEYRLKFYNKRKEYLINKLEQECIQLNEKIRFILYEIDDNNLFTIRKKNKKQVIKLLEDNNFKKIYKNLTENQNVYSEENESNIEENESNIENNDTSDDNKTINDGNKSNGYEYLLNLKMESQTEEMIEKLRHLHDEKNKEYHKLLNMTIQHMYVEDINSFMDGYDKMNTNWISKKEYSVLFSENQKPGTKPKPKSKSSISKPKPKPKPKSKSIKTSQINL